MIRSIRPVLEGLETRYAPAAIAMVPLHMGPVTARIAPQSAPTPIRVDWTAPAQTGARIVSDTPIGTPDILVNKPAVVSDTPIVSPDILVNKPSIITDTPIGTPDIFRTW